MLHACVLLCGPCRARRVWSWYAAHTLHAFLRTQVHEKDITHLPLSLYTYVNNMSMRMCVCVFACTCRPQKHEPVICTGNAQHATVADDVLLCLPAFSAPVHLQFISHHSGSGLFIVMFNYVSVGAQLFHWTCPLSSLRFWEMPRQLLHLFAQEIHAVLGTCRSAGHLLNAFHAWGLPRLVTGCRLFSWSMSQVFCNAAVHWCRRNE